MDILSMLQKMDEKKLKEAVKKAQEFSHTEDGKKIVEKLKKGETIEGLSIDGENQKKIMNELGKNPEVIKKIMDLIGKKG